MCVHIYAYIDDENSCHAIWSENENEKAKNARMKSCWRMPTADGSRIESCLWVEPLNNNDGRKKNDSKVLIGNKLYLILAFT